MLPLRLSTPIKINLALHVGAAQADGYHPVDTLCTFVDAGDRLTLHQSSVPLVVTGPGAAVLPADANNFVLRAARLFHPHGLPAGLGFRLDKAVPLASGVAGGTANGCGALRLLNQHAGQPLDRAGLIRLARGLGADGPVVMAGHLTPGRTFRARGIGERVDRGPRLPPLTLVIANPRIAVPTGPVFRRFDRAPVPGPLALDAPTGFATLSALKDWLLRHRNDLAAPAASLAPPITEIAAILQRAPGCLFARMSGSGASVFGVFASDTAARRAVHVLRARNWWAIAAPPWASQGETA